MEGEAELDKWGETERTHFEREREREKEGDQKFDINVN